MPNRLTRITTRGGDNGESSLADGSRHSKFSPQFAALGDIDELNCAIGIVVTNLDVGHPLRDTLIELQSRLFDLGGAIAMPGTALSLEAETDALERLVIQYTEQLGPLANFILPGGTPAGSQAHLARAVCRRGTSSRARVTSAKGGTATFSRRVTSCALAFSVSSISPEPAGAMSTV